ncbi:MAG: hypothetical protein RBT60_00705 [Candidatus Krumholzibacteria bacterium]|jgi:hypothetical protein|nr:hypothetical protein [Candidatus Krumholzibacteria bacterium]
MKFLLWIVMAGLLAGSAAAQADYNYEPGQNWFGIYRTNTLPGLPDYYPEEFRNLLNFRYRPYEIFSAYVMVSKATHPVLGYDASIILPPELVALSHVPAPGSYWINLGTPLNVLSGIDPPIFPDIAGNIHLSTLTLQATGFDRTTRARLGADIFMGPSEPSGVGGAGPTFNMGGEYMRANFIDYRHSGCPEPSPPVGRVAIVFGGASSIVIGCLGGPIVAGDSSPVATEARSLTAVKALFR